MLRSIKLKQMLFNRLQFSSDSLNCCQFFRMWKFIHIFTILALCFASEVTSTENNIIRTKVGVMDLSEPTQLDRDIRDTRGKRDDEPRSRVRRTTDLSDSEIQSALDKHNELRSQVTPTASNMLYMEWNDDLALMAQLWSDGCNYTHGNPDNIDHGFVHVGQNLYIRIGGDPNSPPDIQSAIQLWYDEVEFYDFETRQCSGVCGHYTQVVWANTYAVGCGITYCPTTVPPNVYTNAYLVTCNYGPAGNYIGQDPYLSGNSCTQCPSGREYCSNNLCRDCTDDVTCDDCTLECQNGGECVNDNGEETCECADGYTGTNCETLVCNLDCQNGGQCVHENGLEKCDCLSNFSGATCQKVVVACPCENERK